MEELVALVFTDTVALQVPVPSALGLDLQSRPREDEMVMKARERSDGHRFDVTVCLVSRRRPAVGANAAALPGPRRLL